MRRNTPKRAGKNRVATSLSPTETLAEDVEVAGHRALPWEDEAEAAPARRTAHADENPALEEGQPLAEGEGEDVHAPDDALGLYLRQMGAIPLLNREQELALAERLEYRRRALPPRRPVQLAHAGLASSRRSSASRPASWPSTRPSTWSPR